uniref:Queuosine 5'-phosphate N-glycosylase/hydrolase n=1 Tax=Peronospora matthiolae TaxID=2874970 RepID=A0AAV1UNQ1_9STRA
MASCADLLACVRPSCAALLAHGSSSVHINVDALHAFAKDVDETFQQKQPVAEFMTFPLTFRSQQDELNFLTLYGLLSFGSGFRKDLHKFAGRGAHDTIVFGLIGMYISVPKLDAEFLQHVSVDRVASYFGIPLERDEEVSRGIYMAKPGPLKPLAVMIQKILNESGQKLVDLKIDDFGAFILAHLSPKGTHEVAGKVLQGTGASAAYLVNQLVATFPGFDDHNEFHGEKVYFLKRAQLAVASIYRRFKDSDPMLAFTDINKLNAFSDNVLPCVLHALGVLEYDAELESRINRGEELSAGQQECELRASAIVACDQIVMASDGCIGILELDFYLWRMGKEDRFRGLERHVTRDTFFY